MKIPFLSYILFLLALSGLAACGDDFLSEDGGAVAQEKSVFWRSPEVLTRAQSRSYFVRDHAVGYSYEAVSGHASSLEDVRCQVVNRAELDRLADEEGYEPYQTSLGTKVYTEEMVYNSFTDYVQNTNLHTDVEGRILLIAGGDAKYNCSIFEDGTVETRIVDVKKRVSLGRYALQTATIMEMAEKHPTVLTASFREAVRQVAECPGENFVACADSFLSTYGTHVVTYAEFGGSLDILAQVEKKKYYTVYNTESQLSADVLAGLFKEAGESEGSDKKYEYLENAKCNITVRGGDVSTLDALNNMNYYGVHASNAEAQSKWLASVTFDPSDPLKTTAAVVNMSFVPIYEFVNNETAKARIKAVMEGSTETFINTLGNRNFVNVRIPYEPRDLTCKLGKSITYRCEKPEVTDFVYAGRHVATICTERIKEIDPDTTVRVVYPIYEGRMQQADGLCLHNGRSYSVKWTNDHECTVTDNGLASCDGFVYILAGVPSFTAYSNITYDTAHALPALEIDTPFNVDGTFNSQCTPYAVTKERGCFFLKNCSGINITSIPNWEYDSDTKRMKRRDEYIYIYNPNELDYND